MKKKTVIWSVEDADTTASPRCIPLVYEGISSLIPLLNTFSSQNDKKLDTTTLYINNQEKQLSFSK